MNHILPGDDIFLKPLRLFRGILLVAIAQSSLAGMYSPSAYAQEASFEDFPVLVRCELSGVVHIYYLSKIGPDGAAVYMSPDNRAGTITITGKATPVGGEWSGSCSGKTLEQLRTAGQAYDLHR
ncbi:hypothetical protein [Neomesorhizobium albiziae]|uniref:hypothetical protein n=1 Tax=Neomesorhizobium albiziae TaxID=335020 RepID=UPI001FCEE37E|nr:hypothetical protein [Mesorhizobium albiziae]